jgi:cytoskeletal protein CcmA (bactofilin family)
MFGNKKDKNMARENGDVRPNSIASGTTIVGDIKTNGSLRLDGELIGTIESAEKVVIGKTGKVKGKIYCKNIDISGEMEGELKVEGLSAFSKTSRITGDVKTGQLAIEAGALFTGTCDMQSNKELKTPNA